MGPRRSSKISKPSHRDEAVPGVPDDLCLSIVVLGASGDLAKKKTFPALWKLFKAKNLPINTKLIGYARSKLSDEDLKEKVKSGLDGASHKQNGFLDLCSYVQGAYDTPEGFQGLQKAIKEREDEHSGCPLGRIFYLALPPSVYPQVSRGIRENAVDMDLSDDASFLRLIIEKPFGMDLESSEELAEELNDLFPEKQIYRIDHYLGKELMQNMLVLRFANAFLTPMWNSHSIANVQICFKEDFGTEGRGGYFDEFGIIRDVMQNHLMQVLALVAMEKPITMSADDIRDEKVKVMRCLRTIEPKDCVLGQYTAGGKVETGYLDDEGVPKDSKTPTFAAVVMHIDNDRWAGVPFIMKAGKALGERKAEVRIQFRNSSHLLHGQATEGMRNELVVRIQPDEAIYIKIVNKNPGLGLETGVSELDLTYHDRYPSAYIPDAYERLILDAIRGDQQHFVRRDELRASWAVFTPLLHTIDDKKVDVHPYKAGSRGPKEADTMIARAGYVKNEVYDWRPPQRASLDERRPQLK